MSAKLGAWGATLIVYGIASLVLPLIGMQLRIFSLFGAEQPKVGLGCIAVGAGLWLVSRSRTHRAEETAPTTTSNVQSPAAAPETTTALACPKCGARPGPGDRFCIQCGTPLAPPMAAAPAYVAPAVAVPARPRRRRHPGRWFLLLLFLGALGAAAWFFYGPARSYTPPATRTAPAVPARLAGTLAEFPVDPATTNRLEPVSVVSQTFPGPSSIPAGSTPSAPPLGTPSSTPVGPYGSAPAEPPSAPTMQAPPVSFPPGMNAGQIPQVATAATSTTYQSPEPQTPPVYVHVLQVGPNVTIALQFAQGIAQNAGAALQGARVQSPGGQTYDGYTVRSATRLVYVLAHPSAGNVIILYTPQSAGFPAVERLAKSVGNGRGLQDYPQVLNTYSALPASAPPGYSLTGMRSFTGSQLANALNSAVGQARQQAGQKEAVDLNKVLQSVRLVIPEHGTLALYGNNQGQEKGVLVGNYGSPRKAGVAWRALSWTLGWAMKKNPALGFAALEGSDPQSRYLLFQKGPYIALAKVPASSGEPDLLALARSLQL